MKQLSMTTGFEKYTKATKRQAFLSDMDRLLPIAFGLQLGGAIGNLIDRLAIPRSMAKLVFANHTQLRTDDVVSEGM